MELTDITQELRDEMYLLKEDREAFEKAACDSGDNEDKKILKEVDCLNIGLYRAHEKVEEILKGIYGVSQDLVESIREARDFAEKEAERYKIDAEKTWAFEQKGNYDLWKYARCRNEGYASAYLAAIKFFNDKMAELGVRDEQLAA